MTYTNYEFTAFSEADLLQGVNGSNLGCGDTFVMPASATTCITVRDNDPYMSGDCRDNARDHYGQQASIEVDGQEAGNGGQIYAEVYHWVSDQNGNWYVMIEIEQEGTNDDYFAFYNGYGYSTPPEGAVLTVHSKCNVCGNWVDYKCLDAGDKEPETGSISGTVFCDTDCDGLNGEIITEPGCDYTIEAESMHLNGFKVVSGDQASADCLVKLSCAGGTGDLKTTFDGKDGTYDLKLSVQDECDGESTIMVKVNGEVVGTIVLDQNGDGGGSNNGGFTVFTLEGIELNDGDEIVLWADGDHYEYVRIDKLELEGHDQETVVSEPTKAGVVIKLIDADGNVIDTTETDADGNYEFTEVPVGDYKIMGVAPDGTEFTIQDAGSDDSIDSDVDANGMSGTVTVTGGDNVDVDLGVCDKPTGSIGGRYFCDENDNDRDDSEPAVANKTVWLLKDGVIIRSTTTDGNGEYCFEELEEGNYSVRFEGVDGKEIVEANVGADDNDSDVTSTGGAGNHNTDTFTLAAGEDKKDVDAGIEDLPGSLSGRFFCDTDDDSQDNNNGDEPGVEGVLVTLLNSDGSSTGRTTTTDANGNYSFDDLRPGDYGVTFTDPDNVLDGKVLVDSNVGDDASDSDAIGDTGSSSIMGISVTSGNDTPDNDAGVEDAPGSLSGRYFCDTDGDAQDNNNGDEPGVEGILVTLLDAGGNSTGRTTTTDSNGNYSFGGLRPGDYGVMFTDPDGVIVGKELVASNVGDDASDSDAIGDAVSSSITGITVTSGNDTPDNDAGVEEPNENPIAVNDEGMTCADQTLDIDLVFNDTDADGDTLIVTEIKDADETAGVGETITLDSGATVTLNADGTATYNGIAAFDELVIGDSAMENFSYTVSDGNGGTAMADVDIKVCGALNTVETIAALLPDTVIINIGVAGDPQEFQVDITDATGLLSGADLIGYCVDFSDNLLLFQDLTADVYSSYADPADIPDGIIANEDNLDLVNWIINQDYRGQVSATTGENFTDAQIQAAIWNLTDDREVNPDNEPVLDELEMTAQEIIDAALANGEDYVPTGAGDYFAVLINPVDPNGTVDDPDAQGFIVAVPWTQVEQDCIC